MTLAVCGAARRGDRNFMLAAVEMTALRAAKNGLDLSEQQSLRCPHCGAGPFGTSGELQEHIEAVHGNLQ